MVNQPIEQPGQMTIDEFKRLYESEGAFELVDGERIPLSPPDESSARVSEKLYQALITFLSQAQIGSVFARTPYLLRAHPTEMINRVRVPDLMYYRKERLAAVPELSERRETFPIIIPPDMTVILVKATDYYSDVEAKLDRYLRDGVSVAWIVELRRKHVSLINQNGYKTFPLGTILPGGIQGYTPGGGVIPGFQIPVQAIFE